ncbi:MAG: LysR family transcriptional regulator [Erysipelotrichaceae bacterium]|nr:LysR family transcriptional regulator [Erysipelotrichaceae bacterium]
MIDFNQLNHLIIIAETGSLSKASKQLHISQPGLSKSMQRLEKDLNVLLFNRSKNGMSLNDNGILALEYAKKIIGNYEDMISNLHNFDQSKQLIKIGSCAPAPVWGLTYILGNKYPDCQINSEVTNDENMLLEGLNNYQYSMIVLTHSIEDKDYYCEEFIHEDLFVSMPNSHSFSNYNEISFEELDGESILLLSDIGSWYDLCVGDASRIISFKAERCFNFQ